MVKLTEIEVSVRVPKDYLEANNLTQADIGKEMDFLFKAFGEWYQKLFHKDIYYIQDVEFIRRCAKIFKKIQGCAGYSTFIKQYDNHNHMFTAKVAGYLLERGFTVTLEPDMGSKSGPHPDLKLEKDEQTIFAECKTSDISRYYRQWEKEAIADLVFERVKTSDQITLYMHESVGQKLIEEIFNEEVIQKIHQCFERGADGKETNLQIHENVNINVMQKPPIIGEKSDLLSAAFGGYLEDSSTRERHIGFSFMRDGRAVGVYSLVNFELKWKDKREQSQKQMIDGYQNIVFIDGADVVGDPKVHQDYFDNVWLTADSPQCSCVCLFHSYQSTDSDEPAEYIEIYRNAAAAHPIDNNLLET